MQLDTPVADSVRATAAGPRTVLLALGERGRPRIALLRAHALATMLGAQLRVLRVVPQMHRRRLSSLQRRAVFTLQRERRRVGVDHLTRAWIEGLLGTAISTAAHETRDGDFEREVATHALEIGACMVVLPATLSRLGARSARIARKIGRPVVVARPCLPEQAIVAATDLRDDALPIVRKALELATHLDTDVVAVHNVSPLVFWAGGGMGVPALFDGAPLLQSRQRRFAQAAATLGRPVRGVLLRGFDPVDAIEDRARALDADLIVVGTRPETWWNRAMGRCVAERVVDAADRSVMVMPLARA